MRKLLFESLIRPPLTEPAPAPADEALAELAATLDRAARRRLGRSLSIREVLVSGWGDTYTQYRAGQSFPIADLPNGTYYIAVTANPGQNLVESDTTNNQALRQIRLSGPKNDRRVTVSQVGIVKDEGYGGVG